MLVHGRPQLRELSITWVAVLWLGIVVGDSDATLDVVSTSPASYALQVDREIPTITVTFNKDILTPDPDAVRVSGCQSGLRSEFIEVGGSTLTITLGGSVFHSGELVHVNLRDDIVSTDAQFLIGGYYFAFTVGSAPAAPDFTTKKGFGASEIPYFIYGGDLDGDGTPDLAVPNEGTHDVSVFLNTSGAGFFPQHTEYPVGLKPSSIFGEDFDNDGDLDLATADITSGTVSVLLNNGDGTYGAPAVLACGDQTRQIHGGDFDGDNDVDLCVTSFIEDHVCLYFNDGAGVFTPGQPITDVPDGPFAIRTGDLENDGDLDIAVACNNSDVLVVLRNIGGGNFMNDGTYFIGNGPWCLNGNDLNGDGFMDLLSVASFGNQFVALINDGTGALSASISTTGRGTFPSTRISRLTIRDRTPGPMTSTATATWISPWWTRMLIPSSSSTTMEWPRRWGIRQRPRVSPFVSGPIPFGLDRAPQSGWPIFKARSQWMLSRWRGDLFVTSGPGTRRGRAGS
jgi:hypothetical protein